MNESTAPHANWKLSPYGAAVAAAYASVEAADAAVAAVIAAYLGELDRVDPDVHNIAMIDTCVRVIGRYEPVEGGSFDADLVTEAASSILSWMADYGVRLEPDDNGAGLNLSIEVIDEEMLS